MSSFRPLTKEDAGLFSQLRLSNSFADTAFPVLYAWGHRFEYCIKEYGSALAVSGTGINNEFGFYILTPSPDTPITDIVYDILSCCAGTGAGPVFEYVPESGLERYEKAARELGLETVISYCDDFSDYLYRTEDFISLSGGRFRTKRGGYNYITSHYPALRFELYSESLYGDCLCIFDKWCEGRSCSDCRYGCEKQIFKRYMELYDADRCIIGLAYDGDEPLSFIACEYISGDTVSCLFQKNAKKLRGLTYWLNRQTAMLHPGAEYLNLGEDIGIPGLRTDKTLLRPCAMLRKYTVRMVV